MKNHNFFLFTIKNGLVNAKSNLKSILLGVLILFSQNQITAMSYTEPVNISTTTTACPNVPTAESPQIVCNEDTVSVLKATGEAGETIEWYTVETGGTALDPSEPLVPGNYYAAVVGADASCPRKLVVVATNNALYFDGTNDFVTLAKNPFVTRQKTFTIEAWIKPDDTNYDGGFHNIFGSINKDGGDSDRGPSLYIADNVQGTGPGGLHFDSYNAVTKARYAFWTDKTTTPLIAKNVWSHVAIVNDGTNYSLFVNGKPVAIFRAPGGPPVYTVPAPPQGVNILATNIYTLGRVDNYYAGLIDEARFWNVARTPAEIAANMEVNLTGTETGLVNYYTFNQGIANGDNTLIENLYDSTSANNTGLIKNFALEGNTSNFVEGYFAQIINQSTSSTTFVTGTIQLSHTSKDGVWSSSSDDIATVDPSTGLVTGVSGGTATITYSFCGLSTTYTVTITANPAPSITQIAPQTTCPGTNLPELTFRIGDDTTPVNSLILTATSSNQALIPDNQIVLGGTGANRTVTLTTVSGQIGVATITITVKDANNTTTPMSFTATYEDTTAPIADIASLPTINGACSVTSLIAPTATDNCKGSITATTATTLPITASTTIEWTYTDGTNISKQEQIVTIADTTAPVADIASLPTINGSCSVTSLTAPTATDNCKGSIIGTTETTLPITASTTIEWTYTDGTNISKQEQIVTIADTTAPIADITSLPTINGSCSVTSLTAPTATDNCKGSIIGTTTTTLPITASTIIEWTYTDGTNISKQEQIVTIADTTAPIADIASLPTITGSCSVTSLTAPTATDNCKGSITATTTTTLPITASTTIEWTYTDGTNISKQDQIVTITGNITALTKNSTVTLDNKGTATIIADDINNGSFDSCGGNVTLSASKYDFNCNDVGENTVTLTVTDASGNTAQGTAIVTVISSGCELEVSQAITPNGDGINDTWMVYGIEGHPNTAVRVFNRWGNEVYFSNNYNNDWDGHYKDFKNNLPSSAAYYYQIDLDGDGTINNQGWLYITK